MAKTVEHSSRGHGSRAYVPKITLGRKPEPDFDAVLRAIDRRFKPPAPGEIFPVTVAPIPGTQTPQALRTESSAPVGDMEGASVNGNSHIAADGIPVVISPAIQTSENGGTILDRTERISRT